jgi:hypothetical protein
MIQKYYHITKSKNLNSILIRGIVPGFCKGITTDFYRNDKEIKNFVFLTNNPKYILENQCGKEWCKKHRLILLEINTDNINLISATGIEFKVKNTISPNRIISIKYL